MGELNNRVAIDEGDSNQPSRGELAFTSSTNGSKPHTETELTITDHKVSAKDGQSHINI